eukprot:355106-Chlamydomonas_euryale.AAC.2
MVWAGIDEGAGMGEGAGTDEGQAWVSGWGGGGMGKTGCGLLNGPFVRTPPGLCGSGLQTVGSQPSHC